MQPHSHLLITYRELTGRGLETVNGILTRNFVLATDTRPAALKQAVGVWRPSGASLHEIDLAIAKLGDGVFDIRANADLTADAKDIRTTVLAAEVTTIINAAVANVTDRADRVTKILRTAAYPARPKPADAAQEAAIAGIKADLQLVLGAASADTNLPNAMISQLRRAISDNDDLSTWVLGSSRWPEDYLSSRGMDDYHEAWHAQVAMALNEAMPANLADARRAYTDLTHPQRGLPVILAAMASLLPQIITELAAWVPDKYNPQRLTGLAPESA